MTRYLTLLVVPLVLALPVSSRGGQSALEKCQQGRFDAASKYLACHQKEMGKRFRDGDNIPGINEMGRCRMNYQGMWAKLQAKATFNSFCDRDRFDDLGLTVLDNLTGLQWEKKTDDGGVNDKDNTYTLSTGNPDWNLSNGTAYTDFLATLNSTCFAGHCDWRLPTLAEIQTILAGKWRDCQANPCIDPVFGAGLTQAEQYWTSTTDAGGYNGAPASGSTAWVVNFFDAFVGTVHTQSDFKGDPNFIRAVRGGL